MDKANADWSPLRPGRLLRPPSGSSRLARGPSRTLFPRVLHRHVRKYRRHVEVADAPAIVGSYEDLAEVVGSVDLRHAVRIEHAQVSVADHQRHVLGSEIDAVKLDLVVRRAPSFALRLKLRDAFRRILGTWNQVVGKKLRRIGGDVVLGIARITGILLYVFSFDERTNLRLVVSRDRCWRSREQDAYRHDATFHLCRLHSLPSVICVLRFAARYLRSPAAGGVGPPGRPRPGAAGESSAPTPRASVSP